MISLTCRHCGKPNSELNPRCARCGGALPDVSAESPVFIAPRGGFGAGFAPRTQVPAAHRYRKLAELARGGTGRIFAARDLVLNRAVAIKEPLDPLRGEARLRAEAEVLLGLLHPSIVRVYDAGVWSNGVPFFAMKLIEGPSMQDAIDDVATLAQRLALLPQLVAAASAIAYAHKMGVIHRDLKPANVVVSESGETTVIDWGLAKRLRVGDRDGASDADRLSGEPRVPTVGETATGAVLGTPAYMAPEQARGEEIDARADVYALGAMLYHLLTGRAPFHDARHAGVVLSIGWTAPAPIEEIQPRAPKDLVAIARKAMACEPAARYASAADLAKDLVRFQTGQVISARHYSRWALRRRWLMEMGFVVSVATALVLAVVVSDWIRFPLSLFLGAGLLVARAHRRARATARAHRG